MDLDDGETEKWEKVKIEKYKPGKVAVVLQGRHAGKKSSGTWAPGSGRRPVFMQRAAKILGSTGHNAGSTELRV
ncbi:hypothetical protein OC861_002915 [Tilletia horrida]|nr:hypothetical protein OC861_002915 [Tilletia horrida]